VPEIRAHPWYCRPLPPLYAQAMGAIMQEQARIDQQVREMKQQRQQQHANNTQQVRGSGLAHYCMLRVVDLWQLCCVGGVAHAD
jgi:hypothetical protein